MKRPAKPRKPKPVMKRVGVAAFERDGGFLCVTDVVKVAVEKTAKALKLPVEEINPECCYILGDYLYFNISKLPDKILKTQYDQAVQAEVDEYRKKLKRYETKFKQYNINLEIWNAWKLKAKKDKLIEQMKVLEKELTNLQEKVDLVDQSIEEAINGE